MRKFLKVHFQHIIGVLLLFVLCIAMWGGLMTAPSVYADTSDKSIETSDPLDDLSGAVIGGKEFDIADYYWNVNSQPQMIYFAEVGYSFFANEQDDYALYIYVYNPSGIVFDTNSVYNRLELAFGEENIQYDKYTLLFLSYSQAGGCEGLFYKFKVVMSDSQKSTALRRLSSDARVYTVVSMELSSGGEVVDYPVGYDTDTKQGSVYTYTGYTLGYGSPQAVESSLTCTVEGFSEYLTLDVEQTVYRPKGDYYNGEQSQLNSCWFTIPDEYIENFGDLSKIKYEWYEYVTKPILVTENAEIWRILDGLYGRDISELLTDYVVLGAFGNYDSAWFGYKGDASYWTSNLELNGTYHKFFDFSHDVYITFDGSGNDFDNFSAVFYTDGESYEDYVVTAEELQEKFLQNSVALGDTSIVGKYASALFEDYVQEGRTMGYNIAESEQELDIYWNTTTKSSLWQQIFGGYDVDTTWDSVSAFHYVVESDLSGSDGVVAERLYIAESDVPLLRERYKTAQSAGETVVLFRYGSTNYYSMRVGQAYSSSADDDELVTEVLRQWSYEDYSAYMVQETVFLNFDIISLTFTTDEGVSTEIPAVMSPEDVFSDTAPPLEENYHYTPWWAYVIVVLAEIIVLLLLRLILCTACGLPQWLMLILLAVTIVLDVFFINTFAGWCYTLIAGG